MFLFKRGKYYHLEYFDNTENRTKRISTKCKNKKDALSYLTDFKLNLKRAKTVAFITLKKFQDEYLKFIELNYSQKYYVTVQVSFRLLIRDIGDVPLNKIIYPQLERFFTETFNRTKEGARTYLIALKSAFNRAIAWGYLSENLFTKIRLPKIPKNNPLFINESELEVIIQRETNAQLQSIYRFLFFTGMRIGELVNLKWNQVSIKEKIIRVLNTKDFTTKGKIERTIPCNKKVLSILSSRLPKVVDIQNDNYVFLKNGIKFNPDYISKHFKKAIREAVKEIGINPKFHLHDLRHSFASNLVKNGVSIFTVKELLGHADISTTQIYTHITIDSLKEAINTLE